MFSFRPIGYIGGDTNARRRSREQIEAGVAQWLDKKYFAERKVKRRTEIVPHGSNWQYWFVHGEVREAQELEIIQAAGVKVISYRDVLSALRDGTQSTSSSVASNITEILKFMGSSGEGSD